MTTWPFRFVRRHHPLRFFKQSARDLARADGAVSSIVVAFSLMTLIGGSALAIDLSSIYVAKRKLQSVADAAAMAAASTASGSDPSSVVQSTIAASGVTGVAIAQLDTGTYDRDKTIDPALRFTAGTVSPNAVRVVLTEQVPLFFGDLPSGTNTATVNARATAARADVAAFSLGTHLLALSGLAGGLLSALAGLPLGLSPADVSALTNGSVPVAKFADALRQQVGQASAPFDTAFQSSQSTATVLRAMAAASDSAATAQVLNTLAGKVGGNIRLSTVIDLGRFGQSDINDGQVTASVDAYSLLRAILLGNDSAPDTVALDLSVEGLASVRILIAGGPGVVHSPLLTIAEAQNKLLQTAQSRILVTAQVGGGLSGIASLSVPIYLEITPARARLAATRYVDGRYDSASIAVTPSIGTAAIAQVDTSDFADMSSEPAMQPAVLGSLPGLKIKAFAQVDLGGTFEQEVTYSRADIVAHVTRQVTNDLVAGIASSLVSRVSLSITTPLGTVGTGPLPSIFGAQLGLAAPLLDGVVNDLTSVLGVRLGAANVSVDQLRCGVPDLM